MKSHDDTGSREGADARAEILYAARRIIERSTDPSITAEARKIVRLVQEQFSQRAVADSAAAP
ncbi:hypothetical protein ACWEKT_40965 [Nocardia takedensis]